MKTHRLSSPPLKTDHLHSPEFDTDKLQRYQEKFFKNNRIHLNNAGLAPISEPVMREMQHWAKRFYEDGFFSDGDYMNRVDWSRKQLAALLGCQSGNIAFFQCTSGAISQFAFQFGLRPDDEVLIWEQEYSSNLYPWREACKRAGARLVMAKSPTDMSTPVNVLESLITPRTRLISVSWVQFQTGAVTDLQELSNLCQARGIELFVDVIQGLGLFDMDMHALNLAGLAGGSHKWLNGPVGVGFLAVRADLAKSMAPLMVGSSTYGTCDDPADLACEPKTDALRFESGSKQVVEIVGLGVAIETIREVGVGPIRGECNRLADLLRGALVGIGFKAHTPAQPLATPWVNVTHPKISPDAMKDTLKHHGISSAVRGPGLRLSPGVFNIDTEIHRAVEVLAQSLPVSRQDPR